jgi:hypothetical protein
LNYNEAFIDHSFSLTSLLQNKLQMIYTASLVCNTITTVFISMILNLYIVINTYFRYKLLLDYEILMKNLNVGGKVLA